MSSFICPECETRCDVELCPTCGTRTLKMKQETQDPMIGKILDGRYKIESLIGRGGMGAVYKAVQTSMKKIVAVKLIRMENASETEAVKRFHREVKAASLLSHPHSIKVFDFGQSEDGDLYMVMEYLDGKSLGKALKTDGPFAPSRALKIVGEVAQSLAEAHSVGLVHRDLKPDNVMLLDIFGDPDFVKVLDFGIAKFMESGEAAVTRTGVAVGTPHYMAPEQARGRQNLGPSADLYALGVMLFELLSGAKPYDAESSVEVLFMHVQNPIPELPDDCPASDSLRDLVRRMMAKAPEARPTAEELIATANALRPQEAGFLEQTHAATLVRPAITPGKPVRAVTGQEPARGKTPSRSQPVPRTAVIPAARDDAPVNLPPRRTTGGQRARGIQEDEPKKSGKGLVIGIVLGVLLLALGGGAYWMFGRPAPQPEVVTPTPVAQPTPPPEKKAEPVKMRLESEPKGALVRDGDKELGRTPLVHEFAPGTTRRALVFKLDGYQELAADVDIRSDGSFVARLKQTLLKMKLESEPSGAVVKDGEKELGKTPLIHEFAPDTTKRTLLFALDGYRDLSQDVEVKADGVFLARLEPKPKDRPVRSSSSGGASRPPPPPDKPKSDKGYKRLDF